jgi:hypothetical protein
MTVRLFIPAWYRTAVEVRLNRNDLLRRKVSERPTMHDPSASLLFRVRVARASSIIRCHLFLFLQLDRTFATLRGVGEVVNLSRRDSTALPAAFESSGQPDYHDRTTTIFFKVRVHRILDLRKQDTH